MHLDDAFALVITGVRGGPDSDVIRFDAAKRENFLHRHADRRTTAPDRDDYRGSKPALNDFAAETKRVLEQFLCADDNFFHGTSLAYLGLH